jgi:Na+-transporting methylmalonyl-CoA/oxaloacetate decarboxylase gamma subunit
MMQIGNVVTVPGQVTFGRDAAMFEGLLSFVAELSVVLWALVILTLVIRFIGIFMYRRAAARTAPIGAVEPSRTVPAAATTTTTRFDEIRQPAGVPAAVAASAKTPRRVPAFAATLTEA